MAELSFVLWVGTELSPRRSEAKRSFAGSSLPSFLTRKRGSACGRVSFLGGRKETKRPPGVRGEQMDLAVLCQPVQGPYPRSPPGPPWVVEQACAGAYPRTLPQIPPAGRLHCVVRLFSRPRLPGALFYVTFGLFFYSKYPPGCFLDEYFCHQREGAQAAPVCAFGWKMRRFFPKTPAQRLLFSERNLLSSIKGDSTTYGGPGESGDMDLGQRPSPSAPRGPPARFWFLLSCNKRNPPAGGTTFLEESRQRIFAESSAFLLAAWK